MVFFLTRQDLAEDSKDRPASGVFFFLGFCDNIKGMNTLTIPKSLIQNDDLIVLPRKMYESLLRGQNNNQITIKRDASFKIKKGQEKFYDELDKDLTEAIREHRAGKGIGHFKTVAALRKALEK